ncbi:MAG TPA: hypothetical protein ENJ38_02000 [Rhodospirillales bacterium]|nr:hypothetical protein [Rhodospirillales bacterium]
MSSAHSPFASRGTRRRHARPPRAARGPLLAITLAYALAACTSTPEPAPVRCPKVAIVYGLDTVEPVEAAGRPLPAEARMEGLRGSCGYDRTGLELDYSVDIVVRARAPVDAANVTLPYFVAVSAPDGRVIDKQVFTARVELAGRTRAGSRERIAQTLEGVGPEEGPGYRVLIGFELPRERAIEQWRRRGI